MRIDMSIAEFDNVAAPGFPGQLEESEAYGQAQLAGSKPPQSPPFPAPQSPPFPPPQSPPFPPPQSPPFPPPKSASVQTPLSPPLTPPGSTSVPPLPA